jgi:hypothetical protein
VAVPDGTLPRNALVMAASFRSSYRLRRRLAACLAAALAIVLVTSSAWAWNASGHLQIALIAYRMLAPETRLSVVELLRAHPRFGPDFTAKQPLELRGAEQEGRWVFAHAATWADIARRLPAFHRERWHYINQPLFLSKEDRAFFEVKGVPNNLSHELMVGADEHELNIVQAIALAREKLAAARTSRGERALYASWLMHLVGDAHQPLHAVALYSKRRFPRGDKGGNDVLVGTRSLHAIWDGFLGTSESVRYLNEKVTEYLRTPELERAARDATASLSADEWIDESYDLALDFAYDEKLLSAVAGVEASGSKAKPSTYLPAGYLARGKEHSKRRAVQAGARLAALLRDFSG